MANFKIHVNSSELDSNKKSVFTFLHFFGRDGGEGLRPQYIDYTYNFSHPSLRSLDIALVRNVL